MFAPRHRRTADELWRVCRRGGLIAICCWTPEGTAGDMFGASAAYMPAPPDFAEPPLLWGTEDHDHVRDLFPAAGELEFERHSATIEWDSPDGFAEYFLARFGPMVTARELLGDRFTELAEQVTTTFPRAQRGDRRHPAAPPGVPALADSRVTDEGSTGRFGV
jgi:hypothetical protein